jgi:hypothetical protein
MSLTARQMGAGVGIAAFAALASAVHSGVINSMHAVFWFSAIIMIPAAISAIPMTGRVSPTQLVTDDTVVSEPEVRRDGVAAS